MDYAITYYDVILVLVVGSLIAGAAIGYGTPISATVSVPLLGLIGFGIILYAIFVRGPVDRLDDLSDEVDPSAIGSE